jgi:hypothetical protein
MKFVLNVSSCNYHVTAGSREEALRRASVAATERRSTATLAVEKGEGRERRAVNIAAVGPDGRIRFFPEWDELEKKEVSGM